MFDSDVKAWETTKIDSRFGEQVERHRKESVAEHAEDVDHKERV